MHHPRSHPTRPRLPRPLSPFRGRGLGEWGAGQDQDAPGYIRPHPLDPIRLSIAFQQWPGEYSIPDAPSPVSTHPRSPGSPTPSPPLGEGAGGVGDGLGSGRARITCGTSHPDPSGYPVHPNRDWAYLLRDAPCAASRLQCSGTSIASHRARGPPYPTRDAPCAASTARTSPPIPHAPAPYREKGGNGVPGITAATLWCHQPAPGARPRSGYSSRPERTQPCGCSRSP
jgi:hypothetical protein